MEAKHAVAPFHEAGLYRRVLGESLDSLPESLRAFHDGAEGVACGRLRVTRGRGVMRNWLADRLSLPKQGGDVRVRLYVVPEGRGERWIRHFDDLRLETRQWSENGLLLEAVGPVQLGYRLEADTTGLRFSPVCIRLCGLPLPSCLCPRGDAVVIGKPVGWSVRVEVEAPLFGLLVRYEGEVEPRC